MALLTGKRVLIVIGGGIAAYKVLELIRRLKDEGASVRAVMTETAQEFITPLAVGAVSHDRVFTDLFDRGDEADIGHIRLARDADLILVAPATADLLAKMAAGLANDLATTVLLAATVPVLAAPAMNPAMWAHKATQRNVARLSADGVRFVGPERGEMAERGEAGLGRMAEPPALLAAIIAALAPREAPLAGRRAVVTAGPTQEPIDPVRYLANRSSGKQGFAIAGALAEAGAAVTLISGPVAIVAPAGVTLVAVETAREMLAATEAALPADIAVMAAAVADWRVETASTTKLKRGAGKARSLALAENPDILKTIANHRDRPRLVIGFAAETDDLIANARKKLAGKGCDWILANDVSPDSGVMGGDDNRVHLVTSDGVEDWPRMDKGAVARRLVERIAAELARKADNQSKATVGSGRSEAAE